MLEYENKESNVGTTQAGKYVTEDLLILTYHKDPFLVHILELGYQRGALQMTISCIRRERRCALNCIVSTFVIEVTILVEVQAVLSSTLYQMLSSWNIDEM